MTIPKSKKSYKPLMFSFVRDRPNLSSLAGLLCAVLAIYYALLSNFHIAVIGSMWAVVFDWVDGIIARKMEGRTSCQKDFGSQLDSLIDIISFGVFPAIFLLSYGNFSPWFLPGAFLIIAVSAIRLSYFNIFGLNEDKTYTGLALDNNVLILTFLFLFEHFINHTVFSIVLYVLLMVLLIFNLASIKTPKFAGNWFYVLVVYTVLLTAFYGWMYWKGI